MNTKGSLGLISKSYTNYSHLTNNNVKKIIKEYNLKPGDILLGEGLRHTEEYIVKFFVRSKITHIMFITKDPTVENSPLYVFESMVQYEGDSYPDLIKGYEKSGPMFVKFIDRYKTYMGNLYLLRLNKKLDFPLIKATFEFYKIAVETIFEQSLIQMLNSVLKIRYNNKRSIEKYFCSELIAELLQVLGLLKSPEEGGLASKYYNPGDFTPKRLNLKPKCGYHYTEIIKIKPSIFA